MAAMREHTMLKHIATHFGMLRVVRATYITQTFGRHSHDDFPLGVIEDGVLGFSYRGEHVVAPAGSINLANPGEPHTGHAVVESGWTYRMFYFDLDCLRYAASELAGTIKDLPFFQKGVIDDPLLAERLRDVHCALEQGAVSQLEQDTRLLNLLTLLMVRHADDRPIIRQIWQDHQAVQRARQYLDAHYAENVSLEQLAHVAYLSPFHLVRLFHAEIGLPPHAYLTQTRINRAKQLLALGYPITDVAFDVGFTDQSHLHKRFKCLVGITPGQYRKNVQDKFFRKV